MVKQEKNKITGKTIKKEGRKVTDTKRNKKEITDKTGRKNTSRRTQGGKKT